MLLDGKTLANEIQANLKSTIEKIQGRPPCLAVVLVGEDPPSQIYVEKKARTCESVGIHSKKCLFPDTISEKDLIGEIDKLNQDTDVDGILVQFPLPKQISPLKIMSAVTPSKDVDGFHPQNMGKMLIGQKDGFIPCTPLGIETLLKHYGINLTGKHAVIIGKSNIVGKPMAALLLQNGDIGEPTVTILHRLSKNLKEICQTADLLIIAAGKPCLITQDMVKEGVIIVDVGITRQEDPKKKKGYRVVGDVDFESVQPKCSYITPVPGGVGPMTIAMLLSNTLKSYETSEKV